MSGAETILSSNGVGLPINNLAVAITYDGSFVSTLTVVYNAITYVQTFLNDGTDITHISQWEPQSGPGP